MIIHILEDYRKYKLSNIWHNKYILLTNITHVSWNAHAPSLNNIDQHFNVSAFKHKKDDLYCKISDDDIVLLNITLPLKFNN